MTKDIKKYINREKKQLELEYEFTKKFISLRKDLSVREYECPKCKSYLDRDFNAAVNIMFEGVKMYMNELA